MTDRLDVVLADITDRANDLAVRVPRLFEDHYADLGTREDQ